MLYFHQSRHSKTVFIGESASLTPISTEKTRDLINASTKVWRNGRTEKAARESLAWENPCESLIAVLACSRNF
ncbi:hypothetical protein ES332_A12G036600v1 [Gossypium tomentosum]|uniref:Uncharacterized protein n=1 Tax=Gossypium tomentosum TaxID=34277 RepID=A0A5D2MS26_GOSTO|nr:hypothetical protein ES332_A12G036600v1 [Gossypium tomentosum]